MSVLVDTNLLTRSLQPDHKLFQPAIESMRLLRLTEQLFIVPQTLYEFWVVCTRPATANGLGMTTQDAAKELANARRLFNFLPDTPAVYTEWERLVVQFDIKGRPAHDARLVAAMIVHGIRQVLTFDDDLFRYRQIAVIKPEELVKQERISSHEKSEGNQSD